MSLQLTVLEIASPTIDTEHGHRLRLRAGYWITSLSLFALFLYGADYYLADERQRALSPKHALLKPGGVVGVTLGILGFCLFLLVFLYPVRLRWSWLLRQGSSRHWLDFHILLGIVTPLIITFHATFKARGIAGMAYWMMIVVAVSGIVGRYIYAQIPRTLNDAAMTFKDGKEQIAEFASRIKSLGVLSATDVDGLFQLPGLRKPGEMSLASALWAMFVFDITFPFRMLRFKRKVLWRCSLLRFGRSPNVPIKRSIALAREHAILSRKVFFLSKSQQLLRIWHIVHRPFSYAFAMLALLHVVLMLVFGYY